jgi:hypothetical protein
VAILKFLEIPGNVSDNNFRLMTNTRAHTKACERGSESSPKERVRVDFPHARPECVTQSSETTIHGLDIGVLI